MKNKFFNMRIKVLCSGDRKLLSSVMSFVRTGDCPSAEGVVNTEEIMINGKLFIIFFIQSIELITSQASGANGILYFINNRHSLVKQKNILDGIFEQKPEFQGLPLTIAYNKDQHLNTKEIVNQFQLLKVKDRLSLTREIDLSNIGAIRDIFLWIGNQIESKGSGIFDAQPKVVKMKPKYRFEVGSESVQKKYEAIMKQRKFKDFSAKEKEQTYIYQELQKIKKDKMEKQINHFNKNRKKMSPFDIKATPNPSIEANLHFFLKGGQKSKTEAAIKIQTDEFMEVTPRKRKQIKKIGKDASTQIQAHEVFMFEKEVQPILDIMTTNALQKAILQIEEQEQTIKIVKYKNSFKQRLLNQKNNQKEKIQAELKVLRQKQSLFERIKNSNQRKKKINQKVITYGISNKFFRDIYGGAISRIFTYSYFAGNLSTKIQTQFLPKILNLSVQSYNKLIQRKKCMDCFEQDCTQKINDQTKIWKQKNEQKKKKIEIRKLNQGFKKRYIHLYYEHGVHQKFTSFAKYMEKQFEGSLKNYILEREEEIQEAESRAQLGGLEQSQFNKIKQLDNREFASTHFTCFIQPHKKVGFTMISNKYQKPKDDLLTGGVLFYSKEGNLLENTFTNNSSNLISLEIVHQLRNFKQAINYADNGIVIELEAVPENVKSIVFMCKFTKIEKYQNDVEKMKFSRYGVQFYDKAIPIHASDIGQIINWEQIFSSQTQRDSKPFSLYVVAYQLVRNGTDFWTIEEVRYKHKSTLTTDEFLNKLSKFYKKSQQIFKQEQPVEQKPNPPSSRIKRKSKRNFIEELPKKPEIKISTRVFKQVQVCMQEDFPTNLLHLSNQVTEWKQFIQTCQHGWEIHSRNGKVSSMEDLMKFSKVGDLRVKRLPPPQIEQKAEEQEQDEMTDD